MRQVTTQQADEIRKCRDSFVYFLVTYCKLRHITKGLIAWDKPYPYQVKLGEALQRGENVVVNKSRQIGCSWLSCAYALWVILFKPDMQVLFLSKADLYAKELLKKVIYLFRALPAWMKPVIAKQTQNEFALRFSVVDPGSNETVIAESSIMSLTTTTDSGRGFSAALVIMDEAAFLPNAEETWAAVLPTTSQGGQVLVVSTPNGVGNFFHRLVKQTEAGLKTGFTLILAYYKDCGFDEEWLKKATAGMTLQQVLQEFELQFLTAQSPWFDLNRLALCYRNPAEHPEVLPLMVKTQFNYIGLDTSYGVNDMTSFVVLNEFGVQIYARHLQNTAIAEVAGYITTGADGKRYETEGISTQIHREFPGVLVVEKETGGDQVASHHIVPDDGISELIERRPTHAAKIGALSALRTGVNDGDVIITDAFTYTCMQTMERKMEGNVEKAAAAKGSYDDPVMALAWAYAERRRRGGVSIDLSALGKQGQQTRMVALEKRNDLPREQLSSILPVGSLSQAPLADRGKEIESGDVTANVRWTDAVTDRISVRPPRMR